jgi:Tol biopolymer transport system component
MTCLLVCAACAAAGRQRAVAVSATQADDGSSEPALSRDGRFVAFSSDATNLVDGDKNGAADVFVRDRTSGTTTRVSVSSSGAEADAESWGPGISGDGRFVVFASNAKNLASGDSNGAADVFLHDRQSGDTTMVSLASDGTPGNGDSDDASVSDDGRRVAFQSFSALVPGDTNEDEDVYVRDRNGSTQRVSVSTEGEGANAWSGEAQISPDGGCVVFASSARNLLRGDAGETEDPWHIEVFRRDLAKGTTEGISMTADAPRSEGRSGFPCVGADPGLVAFHSTVPTFAPPDADATWDVFVADRRAGAITLVSVASDGRHGSQYNSEPGMSFDGRVVGFVSGSPELISGDTNKAYDIIVRDRRSGTLSRVSVASDGSQANGDSAGPPALSGDGRLVAFESSASNLVPGDTNGATDVFLHDRATGKTERVSLPDGVR